MMDPERTMEPISTALAQLKARSGMTDTEIWTRAGISPGSLSRYLHGTRGTKIDDRAARTMEKLASVFELSPDYFVEYRLWTVARIAQKRPDLIDRFYDMIIGAAAALNESEHDRG